MFRGISHMSVISDLSILSTDTMVMRMLNLLRYY